MPHLTTKNVSFWCFRAGIWKQYCHIWLTSVPINFSNCKILQKKQKLLNLGTNCKSTLFRYSWGRNLKNYCDIRISTLTFVKLQKFEKKQQCLNLGPKCLVGPFWPRTPNLGIFALDVKRNLLPYLKSGTSNFSICKILQKDKNAWIWE